ncbi:putative bifunctional diguanylate cyclase/phosphodiesterase [Heyndrickxia acidicola]|uniref:EAL domain-containing protein n=1 Tax=Heyndrickxia acidicola TaxID=209389 RepID=A0ABU6MHH6_9BACI|nr:EAL domain-containing protein [Heyndrickxia acidicola]MED1204128.1 EAL domain-containing protein [Heyndrickxia acidicola]
MSIKKRLPLIFTMLVLGILVANDTLNYILLKNKLVDYNEKEIALVTQEVSYQVENSKKGSSYVENIIGKDLRMAAIAIEQSLPSQYQSVNNEQLTKLAQRLNISHITLLAKTKDDIVGVRSSDPKEINLSTRNWTFWYQAFQQLLSLKPVTVKQGKTLPYYWTGPIEKASSNPQHIDKWGYYYDGKTNYIIDPYLRDKQILGYESRFGPDDVMNSFTKKADGILEITVFNPKKFGDKKTSVYLNGNTYTKIVDNPIWYGTYKYRNTKNDSAEIHKAIQSNKKQSYIANLNGKTVQKTFVPVGVRTSEPYVIGVSYDYSIIQKELHEELIKHLLLSIPFILIVLLTSFIFSRSITKPIGYIVEQVKEIAEGNFGKKLVLKRRDELGNLTQNVNALSNFLKSYVDDLKKSQETIEFQAYHDPLTGLPNRRYFQEQLSTRAEKAKKTGGTVALLFVDIDRFKDVNDTLGHARGDLLIQLISKRICDCLPVENSFLTRQGGDEFVILFCELELKEIMDIANSIVVSVRQPLLVEGNEVYVSASCGLSLYPKHTENIDTLMINSDVAMYEAKKQGGNRVVVFDELINKDKSDRLRIEARLRKAIQKKEIAVYYQPKMNAITNKITGVEALLRWNDQELGFVPPDQFIPVAEETGLIHPLWECTMREACTQIRKWNEKREDPLCLAVNFSARQFQDSELLVSKVKEILTECWLTPEYFEVEITESTLFIQSEETIMALKHLKEYGISISIDDFGTGYSSLNYLKTLPINCLKIDRSFIQDLQTDGSNSEITDAIINMARSLKLQVVAEGVEEEYQKEYLLKNECWHMQGYLFSKPLSKNDMEKYLNQ